MLHFCRCCSSWGVGCIFTGELLVDDVPVAPHQPGQIVAGVRVELLHGDLDEVRREIGAVIHVGTVLLAFCVDLCWLWVAVVFVMWFGVRTESFNAGYFTESRKHIIRTNWMSERNQ